jgi:hypothetical protein
MLFRDIVAVHLRTKSQSYTATDGRSISKSWCRALSEAWPDIYYCLTVTVLFLWGALSDERTVVFCICCWPSPAQSFSGPSPLDLATIFYLLSFETSLFVGSYDSQGHGRGIRPRLHTGLMEHTNNIYSVRTSQETHYVSGAKPNLLMLFEEAIAVYCETHMEHTLCGQNTEF